MERLHKDGYKKTEQNSRPKECFGWNFVIFIFFVLGWNHGLVILSIIFSVICHGCINMY